MVARQEQVEETRNRIVEAMIALLTQSSYDLLTLDEIADRAETTRQTIIRQFGSKDELAMAAALWVSDRIAELDHGTADDPGDALERLIDRYESFGDANARLSALEGRFEFADEGLRLGRAGHREWIREIYAETLLPLAHRDRLLLVDALYAATDVQVWKLLRRDFGRSRAATASAMGLLVDGVLAHAAPDRTST